METGIVEGSVRYRAPWIRLRDNGSVGSGSYIQAKIERKTLIPTVCDLF